MATWASVSAAVLCAAPPGVGTDAGAACANRDAVVGSAAGGAAKAPGSPDRARAPGSPPGGAARLGPPVAAASAWARLPRGPLPAWVGRTSTAEEPPPVAEATAWRVTWPVGPAIASARSVAARRALPGHHGLGGALDRRRRRGDRVNDRPDRRGGRRGRRGHGVSDRSHRRRGLGGGGGDGVDGLLDRRASATRRRPAPETTGSVAWVTVPTVPLTTGSVAWLTVSTVPLTAPGRSPG